MQDFFLLKSVHKSAKLSEEDLISYNTSITVQPRRMWLAMFDPNRKSLMTRG